MTPRRLFLGLALLAMAPGLALAQGAAAPNPPAATQAAPAARPHRVPLPRKSWDDMTARQHRRLIEGMAAQHNGRAPTAAEARTRWDAMAPAARRTLVRETRRHRDTAAR